MARIDLHCHSTRSDGLLAPAALVHRAAARGVKVLALTDHDETGGLAEAHAAAQECGVALIAGVEISVTWEEQTLHVVGLKVDPQHPALAAGLLAIRAGRAERARRLAEALAAAGVAGSLEGAYAFAVNPDMIGRTHFARFLVECGRVKDVKTVFRRYLIKGKPGYVKHSWATLADAVAWIRASGGVAVLAHPGRYSFGHEKMRRLLAEFRELGGGAIEIVTSSHTAEQSRVFGDYARHFGLDASAGSDFHGPGESYMDLGAFPELPAGCTPVWREWEEAVSP